jgi:hypothetical protein
VGLMMGYRHPNPRLVKVHHNYSVEEIARLREIGVPSVNCDSSEGAQSL